MRVLIAFDKFKDALSAPEACLLASRALRGMRREWQLDLCPLTDGGDGFEEIVGHAVGAQRVAVNVTGPLGDPVKAGLSLALLDRFPEAARKSLGTVDSAPADSSVAIIEMARASGLALVPRERRDPWKTTTYGTGQLIRAAAELGAHAIILGVGGSATHDLGLGALNALGYEFRGKNGGKLRPPFPQTWEQIQQIEGELFSAIPPLHIASDVTNPLLGPTGSAAVFGRQKGLAEESLGRIEALSERMADLLCRHCNRPQSQAEQPGSGAGGGISFGLTCAARARVQPGFHFTAACLDLRRRLERADLIITGEGRFDASSVHGKAPGEVIAWATQLGKPVHVFAGSVESPLPLNRVLFRAISPPGPVTREQLDHTAAALVRAIQEQFPENSSPSFS